MQVSTPESRALKRVLKHLQGPPDDRDFDFRSRPAS